MGQKYYWNSYLFAARVELYCWVVDVARAVGPIAFDLGGLDGCWYRSVYFGDMISLILFSACWREIFIVQGSYVPACALWAIFAGFVFCCGRA